MADKMARNAPFIALIKQFERKLSVFAMFDIMIVLTIHYSACKSRFGDFLWTMITMMQLHPFAHAHGVIVFISLDFHLHVFLSVQKYTASIIGLV